MSGLDGGYYLRPTVFGKVDPYSALAQEEVFGPVFAVIDCSSEEGAVRIANGIRYGLHGAVWSGSTDRALAVAARLRTGLVGVNGGAFNLLAPFGGYKQSGTGRECGVAGLEAFHETKSVQLPRTWPSRSARGCAPSYRRTGPRAIRRGCRASACRPPYA